MYPARIFTSEGKLAKREFWVGDAIAIAHHHINHRINQQVGWCKRCFE